MLKKSNMSEKGKEKWMKVLSPDFQSSEESDENDQDIILVKSLPWRAERVENLFKQLDEKIEGKSAQAKRQRRRRVFGVDISTRPQPSDGPKWAMVD